MEQIKICTVTDQVMIPDSVKKELAGKSIEQQVGYYSMECCHATTCWLDQREISHPEQYHGEKIEFAKKHKVLVQDGIIVGVDKGEPLYCFENSFHVIKCCSHIVSYNGHRTTNDGWGYEEEHEWFIFRYIGEGEKVDGSQEEEE